MKQILSIQSHVAFGYVGNRAAVFPLQRLGFDAMAVNTVQFSNHTGYGSWTGQVFSPDAYRRGHRRHRRPWRAGKLRRRPVRLHGRGALGQVIVETVRRVREAKPEAIYCCDPVMGDVGRGFFVNEGIRDFMRAEAVPAADIITPNQFELEFLTGQEVHSLEDALAAAKAVRALGPKLVLLTSLTRDEAPADSIEMLLDTPDGAFLVATPRLPLDPPPNGAGDCVAAVFLAKYLETGDPAKALGHAAAAIYAVFSATLKAGTRELQLIAAQDELVRPERMFEVRKVYRGKGADPGGVRTSSHCRRLLLQVIAGQHFGDLHRVERRALAQVVGDHPHVQAVLDRRCPRGCATRRPHPRRRISTGVT